MAEAIVGRLEKEVMNAPFGRTLGSFADKFFSRFKKTLDYEEYGGALILGIKGVGIVCHGGSSARAIKNAIRMAADYVAKNVQERLSIEMAGFQADVA
jgi:glycerol-3-phosphate acyltransferase PlsX